MIVIWRCRSWRSIWTGPVPSSTSTRLRSSTVPPPRVRTGRARIASGRLRPSWDQADADVEALAALFERRDLLAADQGERRSAQLVHVHAQVRDAIPEREDRHLGLRGVVGGVDVDDAGHRAHLLHEALRQLVELVEIAAAEVVRDGRGAEAAAADAGHDLDADLEVGQVGQRLAALRHDVALAEGPLRPVLELHEHAGHVDTPFLAAADGREEVRHARERACPALDLGEVAARALDRRAQRGLDVDVELALVLLGHELLADEGREHQAADEHAEGREHDHEPVPEGESQRPAVDGLHADEEALQGVEHAAVPGRHLEQAGAEHRREREGDEGGDDDRERDGEAELVEELADHALHERHGDEHRADRERGRDDGEADLRDARGGRLHARQPALHVAVGVLEDDDRVVDDHAHRDAEGQQGHHVEGEAHGQHEGVGRHDRRRDRDGRDEGSAPAPQEEEDHQHREHAAAEQLALCVGEAGLDEDRHVLRQDELVALRQRRLDQRELRLDLVGDGHQVRARLPANEQGDGALAVQPGEAAEVLHAVFDGRPRRSGGPGSRAGS